MHNSNEHKEETPLWLQQLLDKEQELFVPFSAWDDMEMRLNTVFGEQEKINMEKLFPLPPNAALQMEYKLDIHYAQQFDKNIAEKIQGENIALPNHAWGLMNDMLNQQTGENIESMPNLDASTALPTNAWSLMEAALEAQLLEEAQDDILNMPFEPQWNPSEEIALPNSAWAAMESKLNEHAHEDFEDLLREKILLNESFDLPTTAWEQMSNNLDIHQADKEKKKRFIIFALFTLLLGSSLATGAYYWWKNQNHTPLTNPAPQPNLAAHQAQANTASSAIAQAQNHSANISQLPSSNAKNPLHFEQNSTPIISNTANQSAKQNLHQVAHNNTIASSKNTTSQHSNFSNSQWDKKTTNTIQNSENNAAQNSIYNQALAQENNAFLKEDFFEEGSMALVDFSVMNLTENSSHFPMPESDHIANQSQPFEDLHHHNIAEKNKTMQNNEEAMQADHIVAIENTIFSEQEIIENMLAQIQAIQEENSIILADDKNKTIAIIDSFALDKTTTKTATKNSPWKFFAQGGFSNKWLSASNKISSSLNIGLGASYAIDKKNKITIAIQAKQLYANGGFLGFQGGQDAPSLSSIQSARRNEFIQTIEGNALALENKDQIYALKNISIIELPITYQKALSNRIGLEVGMRFSANIAAHAKRLEDNNYTQNPLNLKRYDMGIKALNLGFLAGIEFKVNNKITLICRYSTNISNALNLYKNNHKIYTVRGNHLPEQGQQYMVLAHATYNTGAIILQAPQRLIDSDLLIAMRYYF